MEIETARPHRLYNAGDRISETMAYSLPDGHDIHCIARWRLEAAAKSFFEVPQELRVQSARISVNFLETLLGPDRLGKRGVIWIDANWKAADAEEDERTPIATSDAEAKQKGERFWRAHLLTVAQAHIDQCNQIRAQGGVPIAAQGFTKRALREVGWVDPAESVLLAAQASKASDSELAELRELIKKQGAQIARLSGDKPEASEEEPAQAEKSKTREKAHQPATNARSR